MIRSSKHTLKFANKGKLEQLSTFVDEYKCALEFYINYLWLNKIGDGEYVLDVAQGLYVCPKYVDSKVKPNGTKLSARVLKCVATQASAIVRSVLNKRIKDENKLTWKKAKNIKDEKLEKKLTKPPAIPSVDKIHCDLNSIVSSLSVGRNKFDFWLELSSLYNDIRGFKFSIPLKNFERAKMWQDEGKILNGISISKETITIRYDIPNVELKDEGTVIAIDQGLTTMLTTSRADEFPTDIHGWTLSKILDKLAKCKDGSKGMTRSANHRKNYINWLVKQLNLLEVKELKLENVENIKYGVHVSRKLKHWSNPLIRDSLIKLCEEQGVLVTLVDNEYNSQRCNQCGWTQKANRKAKLFKCLNCDHENDADANASLNILNRFLLVELPFGFRKLRKNLDGFFWNPNMLISKFGEDLTVPQPAIN